MITPRPRQVATHQASAFKERALTVLHREPPDSLIVAPTRSSPSDFDLNPEIDADVIAGIAQRPAAVLIPVVTRNSLTALFTQRTNHLPAHAGQISFPGGKIDDGESALDAALREAEEEIGLHRQLVEPIGYLDSYRTGTGFRITPVVALVDPHFSLALNPDEVAETFEVPLDFLFNEQNFRRDSRIIAGRERQFYAIPYGDRYIWGATAGILNNMLKRFLSP